MRFRVEPQDVPPNTPRGCVENIDLLSERERNFPRSIARWRGQPTQKQSDWLAAIAARLRDVE
jgi:hypothetical protein